MKATHQQIEQFLAAHENWQLDNDQLFRECRFSSFAAAFGFMAEVAIVAEKQDHHPDWRNSYRTVDIWLTTHQFDGISERDFLLAASIDQIIDGNNNK